MNLDMSIQEVNIKWAEEGLSPEVEPQEWLNLTYMLGFLAQLGEKRNINTLQDYIDRYKELFEDISIYSLRDSYYDSKPNDPRLLIMLFIARHNFIVDYFKLPIEPIGFCAASNQKLIDFYNKNTGGRLLMYSSQCINKENHEKKEGNFSAYHDRKEAL